MQFSDALTIARSGRALAFLGSGFSLGAVSVSGESIPNAGELAARLMSAAGETESADFDLAADLYAKKNPDNPLALNTFLEKQFLVKSVNSSHEEFSKYDWSRIYTTNYDNVVEFSSAKLAIDRTPISWRSSPNDHSRSENWIVHLHGFAGNLTKIGSSKEFLLGRQSYIELELLRTQWPTQLQADLAKASAIFVVGFSFNDLHIARLFRLSSSLKRKTFVVIHPTATAALRSYASEFGGSN